MEITSPQIQNALRVLTHVLMEGDSVKMEGGDMVCIRFKGGGSIGGRTQDVIGPLMGVLEDRTR